MRKVFLLVFSVLFSCLAISGKVNRVCSAKVSSDKVPEKGNNNATYFSGVFPESPVREAFLNPPVSAHPWCFWYWMNGCVSKEGIRADLRAMKDAGLGGAYLMPIKGVLNPSPYEPAVNQLSPEWWKMVRFSMDEADSLGLQLAMHDCDGFALAGGPWIKPENSMKKVVWTETDVKGGKRIKVLLKQPETNEGFYKDIAVYAYPSYENNQGNEMPLRITSSDGNNDLAFLANPQENGSYRNEDSCWIEYEYEKPFVCRSICTKTNGNNLQCHRLKVERSDDGINFTFVAQLEPPRHGWQNTSENVTHSIPVAKARFFRFSWTKEGTGPGAEDYDNAKWKPSLKITGIYLSGKPKINQFEGKNGSVWRVGSPSTTEQIPDELCIPEDKVIDITKYLRGDGQIDWKAPKGNWTIMRMGYTSTGSTNATGGGGKGLECDKFDTAAVRLQFRSWFGKACEVAGPELTSRVLGIMHIDSWECGSQNWSGKFSEEFEKRRGYELIKYLPVIAGVPIGSAKKSEQVLYDIRQTISDLLEDCFFRTMADEAHSKGCQFTAESVAPTMMSDGMLHYKYSDIPMGEFWLRSPTHDKPNDMLDAICGAHVYNKHVIQSESFTELRATWDEYPAMLKTLGDRNFALGINKMVFHVFVHNPWLDRKPGMTLDGIGLYFQRDQTWWKPGRAWIEYVTRCQSLLQIGHPVTDIAVFNGIELPRRALLPDRLVPSLPGIFGQERVISEKNRLENKNVPVAEMPVDVYYAANIFKQGDWTDAMRGYSWDTFNPDVILNMAKVSNGRIVLPGGQSYSILVIPQAHAMSCDSILPYEETRRKIEESLRRLNVDGAMILAPAYMANKLGIKAEIPYNKSDFSNLQVPRDFVVKEGGNYAFGSVAWTHRADNNVDLYFVSNQQARKRNIEVSFRITGRIPDIYNPVTGEISEALTWKTENGYTVLPLEMESGESLFVVFERKSGSAVKEAPEPEKVNSQPIDGPWTVKFDKANGGPENPVVFETLEDWSKSADPKIKYYSGTAVYFKDILFKTVPENGRRYWLNVGKVANMAEVRINGIYCGIAWTAPYKVEITKALKNGNNRIEIYVTNTWANRIEGDEFLPESEKITHTNGRYRLKGHKLLEAGLSGPVTVEN